MKVETIREEIAKLDGYRWFSNGYDHMFMERDCDIAKVPLLYEDLPRCADALEYVPTYDNHDDLQRVIDGLNETEIRLYDSTLISIVVDCFLIHKATCEQKREAILYSVGKWEEE